MANCTLIDRKRKHDDNSSLMKMHISNLLNPEPLLPRCHSILNDSQVDFPYHDWESLDAPALTKRRRSFDSKESITSFVDELATACELLTKIQNEELNSMTTSPTTPNKKFIPIAGFFENQWNLRFSELIKFKEEFGHTNVTRAAEHKVLGNWVAEQRRKWKKGKLPAKQQKLLEEIGIMHG